MITAEDMAKAMEQYVRDIGGGVTFTEFCQNIEGFSGGDVAIEILPNVLLWHNLTQVGADAVKLVQKRKAIVPYPTSWLTYLIDGGPIPAYPLAKRPPKNGYKDLHWCPVVFNLSKEWRIP